MITYVTTVQLKDAGQNDYEQLDIEMGKEAFAPAKQRSTPARDHSAIYREYKYSGSTTLQEVVTAAYRAANRTGRKYSFTVMKDKAP
jgi:hypothetical protein